MRKFVTLLSSIIIVAAMLMAAPLTYRAHALSEEEIAWVNEARSALREIVEQREIMGVVYLSDSYEVHGEPSENSEAVVTVLSGQTVFINDVVIDDNYCAWVKVTLYNRGNEYNGYIERANVACSDERFLNWESTYGMNPGAGLYAITEEEGIPGDIALFPESYQPALLALKEKYPNWMFVAQETGHDWDTVIANEIIDAKSQVDSSMPDYYKEGLYGSGWYFASQAALEYYMDPRNGLTEDRIFQFEQLTFNASYHNEEAMVEFLKNTFMKADKNAPKLEMTYPHMFFKIGEDEDIRISPFHLAARVLQEQGVNGDSDLISGNYKGYEGYYNYFNVKASGSTHEEIVTKGLQHAKVMNWTDPYFSILGGASLIGDNYIKKGQDTLYLQKYNVAPDSAYDPFTHQYMQNISAPTTEGISIKRQYANANALNSAFVFKIPVYKNMPPTAVSQPTSSTNIVLEIPAGYKNTEIYVDGIPRSTIARNGRYITAAEVGNAKSAVAFAYNASGTPVGMYVWTLEYKNGAYRATAQPELEDLMTYHGFSIRITGKTGIRYKTGISQTMRNKLISTGVSGYKLKEYGTLVMNNANRGTYPMIKGGEKVASGMSYGVDATGKLQDVIFETVGGRHRYTLVFTGLPVAQYKTEFAFGGYAVLEKNGVETVIYGPVVAKSIYSLAEQLINLGIYESGSGADVFLRQLVSDADNYVPAPSVADKEEAEKEDTEKEDDGSEDKDVSAGDASPGDAV